MRGHLAVLASLILLSVTTMLMMVLNIEIETAELRRSIAVQLDSRSAGCLTRSVNPQNAHDDGAAAERAELVGVDERPNSSAIQHKADLNATNTCRPISNDNLIIVWIDSAPGNFDKRDKIRSTWGSVRRSNSTNIRVLFFIGRVESTALQSAISAEASRHGDIVQDTSYLDTYRNLTRKGLGALRWIAAFCPNPLSVVKADDDTLVNPYNLVSFVRSASPDTLDQKFVCRMTVSKPIRDATNKYFVSVKEFKGIAYPLYCQGYGYMVPPKGIHRLLEAAKHVEFLSMEDVYITGMLCHFAGLKHYPLAPAFTTTSVDSTEEFQQRIMKNKNLIFVGHSKALHQYDAFWRIINKHASSFENTNLL